MSEQVKIRNIETSHRLQEEQMELLMGLLATTSELELCYLVELRDAGYADEAARLAIEGVLNRRTWRDLLDDLEERAERSGFGEPA